MIIDHDIFISYAHIDNETPLEGREGWVSQFHRALEVRVAQLLGDKPRIWRDLKLRGNDLFEETLVQRLPRVALLISVLSPRYVQSEWCTRELREFCTAWEATGGIRVEDKARLFKVVKTPTPMERHPPEVRPLLGYDFFKLDPASGRVRELDQAFGAEAQREFWTRLDDLAHDIADLLEKLREPPGQLDLDQRSVSAAAPAAHADKGRIFLAVTTFDQVESRDAIKRDLQRHGYAVLPDRELPMVASQLETVVRHEMEGCRLSIHLVGGSYGIVPEGASESIVALQNQLAAERSAEGGMAHLIWLPPGVEPQDERQREFLQRLRNDGRLLAGADLLETPLEDLKTVIHDRLEPARTKAATPVAGDRTEAVDELTRVYLICDQRDQETTGDVESYLFDQGFEVTLPAFEGDEAEVREDHEENLRTCDAVLVYYGAANDLWLRRKLRELLKSAAFGRFRPLSSRAILLAPPATPQKERLRTREALVLRQSGEAFEPDSLQPFLAEIRDVRKKREDAAG